MKYIIFFLISSSLCFAQSEDFKKRQEEAARQRAQWEKEQQEAVKRWREQMEADRALIQKYFKSDLFKQMDKEVEKVLKSFDPGAFQKFFDDDNFDKMFDRAKPFAGLDDGDSRWLETPKERILILKMTMPEDAPFEIKIENNHIIVKGTIIKKKEQRTAQGTNFYETRQSINKTFPVPSDVNPDKAKFENKAGEILIKLPKKKVADLYKRDRKMNLRPRTPKVKPNQNPPVRPGLKPIPKSSGDLTI